MAIIYTYPPLTNPVGNELIVVTDVNNRNATRNITVADIASLVPVPGGGGSPLEILDEGTPLTLDALSIDFVGSCVTATNIGQAVTVTLDCPEGYRSWLLGNGEESTDIFDGNLVNFVGSSDIEVDVNGGQPTSQVTFSLTDTPVIAGTYTNATITVDQKGRLVFADDGSSAGITYDLSSIQNGANVDVLLTPSSGTVDTVKLVQGTGITLSDNGSNQITISSTGGGGGMTSFTAAADTGTAQDVSDGSIVSYLGGTDIATQITSGGGGNSTIDINHEASGIVSGTYANPSSITVNAQGHVESITTSGSNAETQGWSPLTIFQGEESVAGSPEITQTRYVLTTADSTMDVKRAKFYLTNAGTVGIAIYFAPNGFDAPTLLSQGFYTAPSPATPDDNTIQYAQLQETVSIEAGQDYIIATCTFGGSTALLGKNATYLNLGLSAVHNYNAIQSGFLSDPTEGPDLFVNPIRECLHFYFEER